VELLAIVQAEQQADALVKSAQLHKDAVLAQALKDREYKLTNLSSPVLQEPKVREAKPNLEKIQLAAKKNKKKAVAKILEALC
jgi:hypothetical protein